MLEFRALTEKDIEVRVAQCKENGVSLLLYKNARVDMQILDETVLPENWQREHYECKGNLFCRVGINVNHAEEPDKPERWVYKSDCGTESNTEAEKGEASDSFKRACFNWGIGRELYTAPFIWVGNKKDDKDGNVVIKEATVNGKKAYKTYDKFLVEKIIIENKQITAISIINASIGKRVFVWQKG